MGLIGCGNFAFTTIGFFLRKRFGRVFASCMDVDINKAASMSSYYKIPNYTTCAEDVINNDKVQMLYIASYHSSHAKYAIQALQNGKHVYIEKPHVVSEEQLVRLVNTMETTKGKVFLGFNRPFSRFGEIIRNYLDKETGPGIYNWFIAGHDLEPDHWYHRKEEGGRILGNLCHWTDFVLRLVPVADAFPIKIIPARAEKSDTDVAVSFVFNDNTVAVISFSAKGHAFEGVKERFTAYKGNTMIAMDDFKTMEINVINKKKKYANFYRDHGHSRSIVKAAENVIGDLPYNREISIAHIWNTGLLFLETKRALDLQEEITIHSYENYKSGNKEFERNPEGKQRPVMSHVRIGERIETSSAV
ncbi:MAG: Gfo/Idh/MocA family oxidoreductase [candidate division Zixibacteria bacterium]|nr:Gfo/Idh/MocA family oxidoreductase [candidate division Zixibacteria bacterium]